MTRRIALTALMIATSGGIACSSGDCGPTDASCSTREMAHSLAGVWTQTTPANGITLLLHLSTRDIMLFGDGSYVGAGITDIGGTVQAAGSVHWQEAMATPNGMGAPRAVALLNVTFDRGRSARFDQAFIARDTLFGVLTFSTNSFTSYFTAFARH